MLLPLAMDTQWEEISSADISSPAEDSEDEYVSAQEGDISYSVPATRSKASKLQHVKAVSEDNRLLVEHFEDEKLSHPEPVVTHQ